MDSLAAEYGDLLIHDVEETGVELGRGSYGVVFEVKWRGEVRAAKKLHDFFFWPEVKDSQGTQKEVRNFKREFRSWAKLDHSNMVRLLGLYYNSSQSPRVPIIVMEKIDISLGDYLERNTRESFPLHKKVRVLLQVAQGLSYLHSQSPPLVHHDLKPDNIMIVTHSFTAKLTDFGMIRAITHGSLTRGSSAKGTPVFMPPEVMVVPLRYDEQLDVFSYGVLIISTLVHDKAPLPLVATINQGGRIAAVSDFDRRKPHTVKFTPEEQRLFMPVVEQCLEFSPGRRPLSSQLVDGMSNILASLSNTLPPDDGNPPKASTARLQKEGYVQLSSEKNVLQGSVDEMKALKEKVARLESRCLQAESGSGAMEESHVKLQQLYQKLDAENDHLKLQCHEVLADRERLRNLCQRLQEEKTVLSENSAEVYQKVADMEYELKGLREFKDRYNIRERRELEQTSAELHQKLYNMEQELEELRAFKSQVTSGKSKVPAANYARQMSDPTRTPDPGGVAAKPPFPSRCDARQTR